MVRPGLAIAGAVLVVTVCIVAIPVRTPAPDFSRDAPASATVASSVPGAVVAAFRETRWSELVPENWDPDKTVRDLQQGMQLLSDSDPRAMERLKKIRDVWDDAPTNQRLDGAAVRIPGYIVPLEESRGGIEEFLLVPYFGACIHTPPPPSNQIVHVVARPAVSGMHMMDAAWVSGLMKIEHRESALGTSSYAMRTARVERYVPPDRQ